jgi:hypothetical protein
MPKQISRSAKIRFTGLITLSFGSISLERRTPKTGIIKLKIETFDTGLFLRSIPQSE